jgi:serine/threonine-protein kinase
MGLPLGTPAYMSPEQIQGDDADARSDIYGLGCVIYEMATGTPPFIGNLGQVMRMHVNDQVVPPSQKRPGLPTPLDKLVAKSLAKKPADRYQKAEDLIRDLEVLQAVATLEGTAELEAKSSEP